MSAPGRPSRRLLAVVVLLLAGCTVTPQPTSSPARIGLPQAIELGHCGVLSPIDFDARIWEPARDVPDAATGSIGGTIVLLGDTAARFDAESGSVIVLLRPAGPVSFRGDCV